MILIQEHQKQRSNLLPPTHLGTEGADRGIHVKPLLPLQNPDQIEGSEPIYKTQIGCAFHSNDSPTGPPRRTGPSHLELGLQLLPLQPRGDGHDVLHRRWFVPCSTPTGPAPLDQRWAPPGDRDPWGRRSLPERSGLVRRKAAAAVERGVVRHAEAAGAAGVEAAAVAARRRAGARVWRRRHMVVGGGGVGLSLGGGGGNGDGLDPI